MLNDGDTILEYSFCMGFKWLGIEIYGIISWYFVPLYTPCALGCPFFINISYYLSKNKKNN